ncbi:MAG: 1-deoxy-D-xylulose-5-phosphate synthase [Fimbriimonadaceae bacterium]|nr:1-deoxy-D-xylulose-5-phosphate synthase [Fimbriimonadaceae bacterium]
MEVYPYLSQIVSPTDLHRLSDTELGEVAREVRQAILDNVSQTGGHFSSNLGTVELTVALYATHSLPPDKVVWDTGHQAYPHKLLTGRLPRFPTLRMHGGLSGFLKREEHELDSFGAGHAGTAISASFGMAKARDMAGTNERVVAITGDAAICSGMSWEALNDAGADGTALTVVLNDNRMSIAPNVGALSRYFNKLRSRPDLQGMARYAKGIVERIPGPAPRLAAGMRHGLTHYFAPENTGTIFEEMGFEYIGPIDGHDLPLLLEIFRNVRELPGPVFIHALTVKGKGYEVAENDACKWHGVTPFDLDANAMPKKQGGSPAYTKVFGDALVELAKEDDKIVAITAAMPDGTGLVRFSEELPERYHDAGIAEQHAVTYAAGLAVGGYKPFCTIYSTFLQRGFDQVLHDVAIQKLPVRFCMDRGGLVGADGPTHHGTFDVSFLSFIPSMVLLAPRDGTEMREMLQWMADYDRAPTAIRYPRGAAPDNLPERRTPVELGRAEDLGIVGSGKPKAAIVAYGSMVSPAWDAARLLAESGIAVRVINARFAKPVDTETMVRAAEECGAIITVEENAKQGGFGQMVRDVLSDAGLGATPQRILALPDRFIEHGEQDQLLSDLGLDAVGIAKAVTELTSPRQRL